MCPARRRAPSRPERPPPCPASSSRRTPSPSRPVPKSSPARTGAARTASRVAAFLYAPRRDTPLPELPPGQPEFTKKEMVAVLAATGTHGQSPTAEVAGLPPACFSGDTEGEDSGAGEKGGGAVGLRQ